MMTPIFICNFLPFVSKNTFLRPSCMSVSIARVRTSSRPSASSGPPRTFEPPLGSEKSSGRGTVPTAKQGADSTAASSRACSSCFFPSPPVATACPSEAAAVSAASEASLVASGFSGVAMMRTLKSRQRLIFSILMGFGWLTCTSYFPGGSSISSEFREPRCSPTQRPSGTVRAMRTRSSGRAEPASMYKTEADFSSTGTLPSKPSVPRKAACILMNLGPIDHPLGENVTPLSSDGNLSKQALPESAIA
mmetsp:Transcript_40017/g.105448  ORF Transcript_40017/g.105448 Transcript_40017/m.105448 type:complete len:249 (-) Transcript_40017:486-1232(-)